MDHIAPPGYFSELRHLPNADFRSQYNMNLTRQVAVGSQQRLRFEQEVRLLKKARAKIAIRDQRIQIGILQAGGELWKIWSKISNDEDLLKKIKITEDIS
ncbi:hypothetical protein Tco_0327881 [Tanacetum coccineum]